MMNDDELTSGPWRRHDADAALGVLHWIQKWGSRWWLDDDLNLYVYSMKSPVRLPDGTLDPREIRLSEGDRLRYVPNLDIEVIPASAHPT